MKQKNINSKAHHKRKTIAGIVLLTLFLVAFSSLASALISKDFQIDETKSIDSTTKYGTITLSERWFVDVFGWFETDVAKITLKENTEVCYEDCHAIKEINLYEKGKLVDSVYFETINEDGSRVREDIKSYKFYVQNGINSYEKDIYEYQCLDTIFLNGTSGQSCSKIKTGSETIEEPNWIEYNYEELGAGNYTLKLEGKKDPSKTVDWIIVSQGKEISEWAIWGSQSSLIAFWNMDETSGTIAYDNLGVYNATVINMTWNASGLVGGTAQVVNGTRTIISTEYKPSVSDKAITINYWLKFFQPKDVILTCFKGDYDCSTPDSNGDWRTYTATDVISADFHDGTSRKQAQTPSFTLNSSWVMVTFVITNETVTGYINGVNGTATATDGNFSWTGNDDFYPLDVVPSFLVNSQIDEIGIWNRSLTQGEIISLYNNLNKFIIELVSPEDNSQTISSEVFFNSSILPLGINISNATLYIWNSTNDLILNNTLSYDNANNTIYPNWTISNLNDYNNYTWNVLGCGIDNSCYFSFNNRTFERTTLIENSQTFNSTAYESESQTFIINVTANSSLTGGFLIYNGTRYAATKSGDLLYRTLNLNSSHLGNNSIQWNFTYAGNQIQSTNTNYQNVTAINFGLCGGSLTIPYLNITFQDESTLAEINASITTSTFTYYLDSVTSNKTYLFSNTTANPSYTFCASPAHKTFNVLPYIQYKQGTDYPQRIWSPTFQSYTNVTTNQTLYLLGTADGIYENIQVINAAEQPVSGASVIASRYFGSELTIVAAGTTADNGIVSFWLNPDYLHYVNVTATGYDSVYQSFFPLGEGQTVSLGSASTSTATTNNFYQGIDLTIEPANKTLENQTAYDFNFILSSSYWDVSEFGFYLYNSTNDIVDSNIVLANGGTATVNYNTGNNSRLYMKYYWVIDSNYTNGTSAVWYISNRYYEDFSILHFKNDLLLYLGTDMFGLDDFGLAIILFIFMFIATGLASYKFGLSSPGAIGVFVFSFVLFLDVGLGLLDNLNPIDAVPHFMTVLTGIIMVGVLFREVNR